MIDRLNENCEGCRYDGNDEGAYFCLSCTLIGEYIPHIEKLENEMKTKIKQTGCIFINNETKRPALWVTSKNCFTDKSDPNLLEINNYKDLPIDFDWLQLNIHPVIMNQGQKGLYYYLKAFCNAEVFWIFFMPSGFSKNKRDENDSTKNRNTNDK